MLRGVLPCPPQILDRVGSLVLGELEGLDVNKQASEPTPRIYQATSKKLRSTLLVSLITTCLTIILCDCIKLLIHSQERASCCCLVVAESHNKVTNKYNESLTVQNPRQLMCVCVITMLLYMYIASWSMWTAC